MNDSRERKRFSSLLNELIISSLKKISLCPDFKNCENCIIKGSFCSIVTNILDKKINLYYSISKGFKLLHLLWILKNEGVNSIPKLILLHGLMEKTIQNSQFFKLKKKYYYYEIPYKNKRIEIFKNGYFNWSNYKNSIYNFNEYTFNELINNKQIKLSLYFFRPAFYFALEDYENLNFNNNKDDNEKDNLLDFSDFNFIIDVNSLRDYFDLILNFTFSEEKRKISEKILNSDSLLIDYKYRKILFNYTANDPTEVKFLRSLFENGILSIV